MDRELTAGSGQNNNAASGSSQVSTLQNQPSGYSADDFNTLQTYYMMNLINGGSNLQGLNMLAALSGQGNSDFAANLGALNSLYSLNGLGNSNNNESADDFGFNSLMNMSRYSMQANAFIALQSLSKNL